MTESEKEELQEKALAVLRAMKSEKKYFFGSPVERLVDDNEKSQTFIKRFRVGEYTFKEKMTAEEYARRYGHECYTRELKRREDARKHWGKIFERPEEKRVYERLFPEDRNRDLEDKNLFNDRMNCIAKAQERFHSNGFVVLKKFNERLTCKKILKSKAVSDDVQEFRDRLELDRFKSLLNHVENRVTQTLKKGSHKENHQ